MSLYFKDCSGSTHGCHNGQLLTVSLIGSIITIAGLIALTLIGTLGKTKNDKMIFEEVDKSTIAELFLAFSMCAWLPLLVLTCVYPISKSTNCKKWLGDYRVTN